MSSRIELFGPAGDSLRSNTNGVQASVWKRILATGIHTVLISDSPTDGNDIGDYALFLQRVTNPPEETTHVQCFASLSSSISLPGEHKTYVFCAAAGDLVTIRMSDTDFYMCSRVELFNLTADTLSWIYNCQQAELQRTLPASGRYCLIASDYPNDGNDGGDFLITVLGCTNCPPSPPSGLVIQTSGSNVVLNWNPVGGADGYVVYRSLVPDGPFTEFVGTTSATTLVDPLANGATSKMFYQVRSYVDDGPMNTGVIPANETSPCQIEVLAP